LVTNTCAEKVEESLSTEDNFMATTLKMRCLPRLRPGPHRGAYSAPPDPQQVKGREGGTKEGRGRGFQLVFH
jgi:hypothetical protein